MSTLDRTRTGPARAMTPVVPGLVEDTDALVSTRFRLTTLAVVVVLFVLGQLGALLGWRLFGELATSAFLQVGPGVAACAFLRPLPRHVHLLLSVVGGAAIGTVAATVSALTGAFSLGVLWPVLAGLTLVAVLVAGVRDVVSLRRGPVGSAEPTDAPPEAPRSSLARAYPGLLCLLGGGTALVAAAVHRGDPRPVGAAVTAGPLWFLGVAVCLAALGLAWAQRSSLAVPVLTLSTVVVASQGLMYREPTAVVAARHIGLVDYVLTHSRLDRSTDIYQAWAGLFASAALNVRAAGIEDLFRYAAWWGVLATPVMVLAVRALAGRFVGTRRAWLAALLFGLGSSLNTSFFAPQVFGFLMAVTVLALVVVRPGRPALLPTPAAAVVVGVLSVATALTHQISPYMLTLALVALAVFGLVRPRWTFVLTAVPAVAWALINQHLLTSYVSVSAFGRLFANLSPPEHSAGTFAVPLSNRLAFGLPAAALVVIGLLALVTLLRRRDRTAWGLAVAAGSPVVLMAGTSYGQEGIFRVALFALPWLAVLACLPLTRPTRWRLPAPTAVAGVGIALLLVVDVVGLTGMDWARVIRSGDVQAATWVERTAPTGSVVLALGTELTLPDDSTARYADTGWISRSALIPPPAVAYPTTTGAAYDADADLRALTARFALVPATQRFAVAAQSTGAYDQRYGNQRYADHEKLSEAIARSPQWQQVFAAPGVVVYRLGGR